MLFVLTIVAPVFGLIALGYVTGSSKYVSEACRKGLAEFAFSLAIPALLFHRLATAEFPETAPFALWTSFFGAALLTGAFGYAITIRGLKRSPPDGVSIAMAAMYSNAVMLGIPICVSRYGDAALAPLALIILLQPPLMWLAGLTAMGLADNEHKKGPLILLQDLARELGRNPVVIATIAGALWGLTGLGLFAPMEKLLKLLAQAGIPAALVALGLALTQFRISGQSPTLAVICTLKLIAMPTLAWVMAGPIFGLPPVSTGVVVLVAAMPTGANAFLFADRFNRAVDSTSGAVALSTTLSCLTVTVLLFLL